MQLPIVRGRVFTSQAVMRQALRLTAIGLGIGLLAAWALVRLTARDASGSLGRTAAQ